MNKSQQLSGYASSRNSFRVVVSDIALEPRGSAEWTVAGKIRKGRQVTTLNV
jgi:hypothetical protein